MVREISSETFINIRLPRSEALLLLAVLNEVQEEESPTLEEIIGELEAATDVLGAEAATEVGIDGFVQRGPKLEIDWTSGVARW